MTIAIGVLASEGIVFASDTQLTQESFLKSEEGKLSLSICPIHNREVREATFANVRSLGIAGSGNAQYVKELRRRFSERFSRLKSVEELVNPEQALQEVLSKMHEDHVIPFDRYPLNERPEVFMVMGTQIGEQKRLWSTEKNLLVEETHYAAVGVGAAYAKILLGRFYPLSPAPNLITATLLAAYVIFNVKETIDGCGQGTDIFLTTKEFPSGLDRNQIRKLEEIFRKYERLEYDFLMATIGNLEDGAVYNGEQLALVRSGLKAFLKKVKLPGHQPTKGDQSPPPPLPESPGGSGES
ncbi:MAG TPA: hypothetical protein VEU96_12170 [Bryobacteraceae bacterium]|nr:hypothetical protein [Bryobacteraceae bacterium]